MAELTEKIPVDRLTLLNKMTVDDYIKLANTKKYKKNEIKDHFKQIKSYIKDHIKCKGEMKKVYKYSESAKNGRLYGVNSIQNLPSSIRGFLFGGATTDIDMKNAHPHILEWICRTRDIRCPNLTEYVNNRDGIISKLKMVGIADPKFEILKMLNTEKPTRINNDCENILKNLRDEIKTIRVLFKSQEDFVEQLQQAMIFKPNNVEGSFVNRVLCIYENKFLQTIAEFLHSRNLEIAEYAFDGLLVYGDYYNDPSFVQEIQDHLNNTFETLNMTLTMKPHSTTITYDYLENLDDVEEIDEHETYDYMKEEFEKTHFKIINKSFYIKEHNGNPIFMKKCNLVDSYEHLHFKELDKEGNVKQNSFIQAWTKDPTIKSYVDIDTYPPPLKCPDNMYNLWVPFAMEKVEQYEQKDISVFLNHIKILCNHEEKTYDYFIKWLGQMIQYPADKTIMILFQGAEGCGKGMLFKIIEYMIGNKKYLETTSPERDVWGQFNGLMASSFFVYLNELSKKQSMETEHRVKGLITDPNLQINTKGKDSISTTSYHRFCCSSNDEEPINTHKGDRRKMMVSASNELKGNFEYFNNLNKCIENVNFIKSFYEYLKSIPDLDKFNSIQIPMTEYQSILCELSITPIEAFVRDMIQDTPADVHELTYDSNELFDMFKCYLQKSNTKYEVNLIKFGVRLTNLKLNGISKEKGRVCNKKKFDVKLLKKHFMIGCQIME
jgi:hypothetical protein